MAENATFLSVCAGESQAGNPIGSALVLIKIQAWLSPNPRKVFILYNTAIHCPYEDEVLCDALIHCPDGDEEASLFVSKPFEDGINSRWHGKTTENVWKHTSCAVFNNDLSCKNESSIVSILIWKMPRIIYRKFYPFLYPVQLYQRFQKVLVGEASSCYTPQFSTLLVTMKFSQSGK